LYKNVHRYKRTPIATVGAARGRTLSALYTFNIKFSSASWAATFVTRLIRMCDVTQSYVWCDSFICGTWLIHMCDVTVSRDSCISVTWLVALSGLCIFFILNLVARVWEQHLWLDSFICVTWPYDVTHVYVGHDSFICVTWLMNMCHMTCSVTHSWDSGMCDMTHPNEWRDSFTCVTCFIHMCDVTHSYVWCDSSKWVPWLIHMCDVPRLYVWRDSFLCVKYGSFICVTWLAHSFTNATVVVSRCLACHTATHCNTLQHTATHCNTLQCTWTLCNTLQHTATHYNTLKYKKGSSNEPLAQRVQHPLIHEKKNYRSNKNCIHTATHCRHTAAHCNTLQHIATHCNTLQHIATYCNTRRAAAMSPLTCSILLFMKK